MISVRNRKTSIPLLVAFFSATVAKSDIYVRMYFYEFTNFPVSNIRKFFNQSEQISFVCGCFVKTIWLVKKIVKIRKRGKSSIYQENDFYYLGTLYMCIKIVLYWKLKATEILFCQKQLQRLHSFLGCIFHHHSSKVRHLRPHGFYCQLRWQLAAHECTLGASIYYLITFLTPHW